MSSSSCTAQQQPTWRERKRDPDDPPAVDVPSIKATLEAARRLADALVAMSNKALGPALERAEENAVAMRLGKEPKGEGDAQREADECPDDAAPREEDGRIPEPTPQPAAAASVKEEEEEQVGRKSARQASRASTGRRPAWAALMAGSGEASWWSDDDEEEDGGQGKNKKKRRRPASEVKPRVVGRAPVQVFRGVLPRAAIDRLLKGEPPTTTKEGARNRWPGIHAMLRGFLQCSFASSFTHPYIAEVFSRCDSGGPPQRLDLFLTPSGARALLTPPAIAVIEVRKW